LTSGSLKSNDVDFSDIQTKAYNFKIIHKILETIDAFYDANCSMYITVYKYNLFRFATYLF